MHGDICIGISSSKSVHRHICFGQMSRCIKRFLEEPLISSGVQSFVLNLDKIQDRECAVQVRVTPGPNPPRSCILECVVEGAGRGLGGAVSRRGALQPLI